MYRLRTQLHAARTAYRDVRYDGDHHHSLLLRPVGQTAFVSGLIDAIDRSDGKLTLAEATRRANKIDWSAGPTSIWRDTRERLQWLTSSSEERADHSSRTQIAL